ncbi:MAG TPA: DUF3800 domain-containing protein [Bacteroidales bacterium]|nr:DUF3800 domain-containing protein [Bacteroidales bacterium]
MNNSTANKTFNIYCDESCHIENDHKAFMFLGSVSSAYNQVRLHTENIKNLKKKHNFYAEIKWSYVSSSKIRFYIDLVDYFFATDLKFRAVGINKSTINNGAFNKTYDDFYYTMYYYLLNHNINTLYNYNVYLDIKDTLSARKVNKLKDILNTKFGVFRNVQNIHSYESLLMQLADFLMGAISYFHNDDKKQNIAKIQIIDKIKNHSKESLTCTNHSKKLNLFFIELR